MNPFVMVDEDGKTIASSSKSVDLSLSLDYDPNITFVSYQAEKCKKIHSGSHEQNSFSFLKKVAIANKGTSDILGAHLEIRFLPDTIICQDVELACLEHEKITEVTSFDITLDPRYLYELSEEVGGSLILTLKDASGQALASLSEDIHLLPISESASKARYVGILASYVTPNDDKVKEVANEGARILQEKYGHASFSGYQSHDPNEVIAEMDALYLALQKVGIHYSNPPASFELTFQRVRLPYEVLQEKTATCIDFALLYASLLENIGLYPVLVLLKGHAMVGSWLSEEYYPQSVIENSTVLDNAISKGIDTLALINIVCCSAGETINFAQAKEDGEVTFHTSSFDYALDIERSRNEGLLPIPTPHQVGLTSVVSYDVVLPESYENEKIDARNQGVITNAPSGKNKFDLWEEKLLDLNTRNNLINLRMGASALQGLCNDAVAFLSLCEADSHFSLLPKKTEPQKAKDFLGYILLKTGDTSSEINSLLEKRYLSVVSSTGDAEKSLIALSRKANTEIEESGCNPLFITVGAIEWYDNDIAAKAGKRSFVSPILLIPASMPRRRNGPFYGLDIDKDGIQFNTTAFEYFKQFCDLDFSEFNNLFSDKSQTLDLQKIYNTIRHKIEGKSGWRVIDNLVTISMFSFAHFVMWSDLKNYREVFLQNPIVRSLVNSRKEWASPEAIDPSSLDDAYTPSDLAVPLSADSSQLAAIVSAEKGESFVLDGPPGTGKSQTIANMIVNGMAHNQRILFVAEKEVALSVVKSRLDHLGLGHFCLQIHSAQANKKEVLGQLESALAIGQTEEPKDYLALAEKIAEEKAALNDHLKRLHTSRSFFVSIYDAIVRYLAVEKFASKATVDEAYARAMSEEKYQKSLQNLSELATYSLAIGGYAHNAFLPFTSLTYSMEDRDALFNEIETLFPLLTSLQEDYAQFLLAHCPSLLANRNNLETLCALLQELQANSALFPKAFLNDRLLKEGHSAQDYLSRVLVYVQNHNTLLIRYNESALTLDEAALKAAYLKSAQDSFFSRLKTRKGILKSLKANAKNPKEITRKTLIKDLDEIALVKASKLALNDVDSFVIYLYPNETMKSPDEIQADARLLEHTLLLRSLTDRFLVTPGSDRNALNTYIASLSADSASLFANDASALLEEKKVFYEANQKLKDRYAFDALSLHEDEHYFASLLLLLQAADKAKLRLSEWVHFLGVLEESKVLLPKEFLISYEEGYLKEDELRPVYDAALFYRIIVLGLSEEKLASLSALETEQEIAQYKEGIAKFTELTVQETAARVTAKYPSSNVKYASSALSTTLHRYCASGGRGKSLRGIFDECGSLIHDLCPCFLMSPLSVAQYLEPGKTLFDLVIYDEASQIPTAEAIGPLARAKAAVIAGDQEQMPPTNYFTTSFTSGGDDVEDVEIASDDLESFLDDAVALDLPRRRLNWHYRSNHESLIAFSNNRFYDNSLLTFPSPENQTSRVSFRYIKGRYEMGRGINKDEANAIVEEILKRIQDPELKKKSIGVITFNEKQQNLVEDLLQAHFDQDPTLESNPGGESIFIKNLENVQGDERDLILFSICFGPDPKTGIMPLNFGPLSREKGERRLNVAVSRARDEMIVFSSALPEMIRADKALNEGASYLKAFLLYAKMGPIALRNNAANAFYEKPHSVSDYLSADLRKAGLALDTAVGTSSFRIDIAIKNPLNPSEYCLGILMDSPSYASAATCQDRNLVQPMMLSRLSWRIMRVWSVEYLDHAEAVVQAILEAVKTPAPIHPTSEEKAQQNPIVFTKVEAKNPYPHQIPYPSLSYAFNPSDQNVYWAVHAIMEQEAPMAMSLLKKRIKDNFGLARMTPSLENEIRNDLSKDGAHGQQLKGGNLYLWAKDSDRDAYAAFRVGGDRELTEIPYQEIGNAMEDIVSLQGQMSLEDLYRLVNGQFGYLILSEKSKTYLATCLKILTKENRNHLVMTSTSISVFYPQ